MIEEDYILLISNQVRNFKKIEINKYRFSCPDCGDSKKIKSKARGNIFLYKGEFFYHCYKCGVSHKFHTFLKIYFPDLYTRYVYDKFGYSKRKKCERLEIKPVKPKFKTHKIGRAHV